MPGTNLTEVRRRIDEMLAAHATVGAVIGVLRDGRPEFFIPRGFADLGSRRPVDEDTIFRVASITKTFTAIGVLQLAERGLVDLDAPVGAYLRAFHLTAPPEWRPATVRQLLTHTAGIGETAHPARVFRPDFGESVPPGQSVPSLAEYYRGALRVRSEPGTAWTYSNHGFATLGQLIEDVSGIGLDKYLREQIFMPLGMRDTQLTHWGFARSRLAVGYTHRSGGPRAVTYREMVPVGAAAANSTARDMSRYLAALLGGGANEHGAVLESDTLATMFAPQYQPDTRLPGMGLGFFRGEFGGHPVVEHQGILPGFDAQIWAAPEAGVGVLALTNGAHRGMMWLPAATAGILRELLGVPDPVIRNDIAHHPEIWRDICGHYTLPGSLTDVRARAIIGAGVTVGIRRGRPVLRVLTPIPSLHRGLPLHPDDPHDPWAFRLDLTQFGMGTVRLNFSHGGWSGTTTMHFEPTPMGLYKRPDR